MLLYIPWTKRKSREIIEFIDTKLFPFLGSLSGSPERNTIGVIFSEVKSNKMRSASNLKDVIDIINEIDFNNPEDSHILSQFYEEFLVKLGRESGYAGEYYTPRPVVRLMVRMIDPKFSPDNDYDIRVLVINPKIPKSSNLPTTEEPPKYPQEVLDEFSETENFVSLAKDTKFIDYQNAQIILVGAREGRDVIKNEIGIEIVESFQSADIFNKLRVRKDQVPIRPLTEGKLE